MNRIHHEGSGYLPGTMKDEYSFISHGSFIDTNVDFGEEAGLKSSDSR